MILVVGLNYAHNPLASRIVLLSGSFIDFVLATAISKNRLLAKMQGAFIREIDYMYGLRPLPIDTDEMIVYLSYIRRELYKARLQNETLEFFQRRALSNFLIFGLLVLALVLLSIGLYTIWTWSIL
ncbi:MAG: hypothetical protein QW478_10205 [Candidatus Micrarchaeaceae archaeon]